MSNFNNSIGYNHFNQYDNKFAFSKTQKLDFKDTNMNLFNNYHVPVRDGITARDHSNENYPKKTKPSPLKQ